ncbi:MAG: protein-glutamate O-methyltransferase CheR [Ginsengibacter sp.]|jgi:chemotaxis protein methyltransferase CheR
MTFGSTEKLDEQIDILMADAFEVYGYDFSGYSRASFKRRILRLFVLDKMVSFAEFRYKIRSEAGYFNRFLEQVTINVTEMFRDPDFYKCMRDEILPNLGTYPFIRIWVAGCSTGEEAYSMAILLKELNLLRKSLIYATDINSFVLEKGAKAMFPMNKMKQYSENYIESGGREDFSEYYIANYTLAKLNGELREKIVFSTHNLVSDKSFNEFQLILCRNVLIYFDRELQSKVFTLFDESLDTFGYLALGTKETLIEKSSNKKYKKLENEKIWRKISNE